VGTEVKDETALLRLDGPKSGEAVFWPGKSHGQRSLVGYSPWGRKEWDTT